MKNEIPILEFDMEHESVIMPTHKKLNLQLPRKAVFAFLGDHIDQYTKHHKCVQVGQFISLTKAYHIRLTKCFMRWI